MDEPHRIETDVEPHRGTLVLVLGAVSIAVQLLGPVAWYLGARDQRLMDEGRMDPAGRDSTRIGTILGMVGTGILALQVLWICFVVSMIVSSAV